ncbi:hypothetical protein IGI37_000574 [Enterococcus sp. AZ194]|uniref:hypothetical protein n=1 Tax=Enterococcus sp. AZ194 TaxID=2774629 RepID=UPI003F278D0A
MGVVRIYLKRMWLPLVCLAIILVGQLLTTRMNVYFTKGAEIPSAIEVVDLENSQQSVEYITRLKKVPNLQVTVTDTFAKEHLKKTTIQGVLILPKEFSKGLATQKKELLTYYCATGIKDTGHIQEVILSSLLQMKGEALYQTHLKENGLDNQVGKPEISELFQVVYYNALGEIVSKKTNKPVFTLGLSALFILLSVLYFQSYLPGEDQRRFVFYGRKNLYKQQAIVAGILFVGWLSVIGLFLILMPKLIEGELAKQSLPFLLGVLFYCFTLSFLVINSGKREWLSFLFIPWFILNMTMGGAVWGVPSEHTFVTIFLPVSYVMKGQLLPLYVSSGAFCLIAGLLALRNKRK